MWRFIPAGAGNTIQGNFNGVTGAVYPRWRGEHFAALFADRALAGLSPLARGTRGCGCAIRLRIRFIPAGAGNTLICCDLMKLATVYPRWRGEHTARAAGGYANIGLSPLARGTRVYDNLCKFRARFIPAGAGNTLKIVN